MNNSLTENLSQILDAAKDKEHIIWDWNGTLLDDVEHVVKVMNSLLEEHQLPLINSQKYREIFGFPVLNYYVELGFDFTKVSFEDLCHKFVDRFMRGLHDLQLLGNMPPVLQHLHTNNFMQSVLSATDQENLDLMMKHFELTQIFKHVYGVDNKLASSKIQRGRELIKISGIALEKTLIIGDTLHDLEVANELGIDALLLSHGHQSAERLLQHHQMVI
jgi:phosphoglycolate phosphatase